MVTATYLIVNLAFTLAVLLLLKPWRYLSRRLVIIVVLHLLVATAIFDSLIIWADIVGYDYSKTLGLLIGFAPVEDFFYAIMAAIIIPTIWQIVGEQKGSGDAEKA